MIGGFTRENARADVDFILEIGNRGKRSIAIDIKSDTGREYFGRLLATADVFLTNWLPAALERARLDGRGYPLVQPEHHHRARHRHRSAGARCEQGRIRRRHIPFPRRSVLHHDTVRHRNSRRAGSGVRRPAGRDHPGRRCVRRLVSPERTGEPSIVDSSLLAQAMWTIAPSISVADLFDIDGIPGAPPGLAINPLVNRYKTHDNRWIQLVFLQPDRFWAGFCERIGLPELATDERFVPSSNLIANAAEASALVGEAIAGQDLEHWRKALADEPGVWAALATPKETFNDPQVGRTASRSPTSTTMVSSTRSSPLQCNSMKLRRAPARAPEHGQHTEEILLELDLDWDDISAAKDSGAIL